MVVSSISEKKLRKLNIFELWIKIILGALVFIFFVIMVYFYFEFKLMSSF